MTSERRLRLDAVVLSADGRERLAASDEADSNEAIALGVVVAKELLRKARRG